MDQACDDEPVSLEAPGVRLERDAGCGRSLKWVAAFDGHTAEAVSAALAGAGLADGSRLAGLHVFALGDRHELLVVPGTGRIQLRLDVGVAAEERPAVALRLGRWVAARLGGCADAPERR